MKEDVISKVNMKPFEKLTPSQKGFIGTTFPTPKGGVLTVVGVDEVKSGSNARFILECNICSQDEELFPERFLSVKGNLINGAVPCGCAKITEWSENQYIIKIQRECEKRGYVFRGWNGTFKGKNTKLELYNPVTENEWCTTSISSFLNGRGDPVEGREKILQGVTKDDSVHIEAFMKTGVFLKGTTFTRNKERVNSGGYCTYWDVTCPECSNDMYVQNRLCSGVFTSHVSTLKKGQKPCRCSNFQWTKEQREFQIKNIFADEGLTWAGWVNSGTGYKNGKTSKFEWVCQKGHLCSTSVGGFINKGTRCKTCRELEHGVYGYYKDRTQEKDFLYVYTFKDLPYIKIGRTFEPDRRLKENQKRVDDYYNNKKHKISTVRLYSSTHEIIYNLEQYLINKDSSPLFKGTFDESLHMIIEDGYGSSELLKKEGLEKVVDFLDGFVYGESEFMGCSFKLNNELEDKV